MEENILMFSYKTYLQYLSSIDVLYIEGTIKSTPKFFYQPFTIHGLSNCHYTSFVNFLLANKHQTSYEDIFRHTVLEAAKRRVNVCQQLFMLTSKPPFPTQ